jgi:hypothetical protein
VHIYELADHLETIVADIAAVDGLLFINHRNLSQVDMQAEIDAHPSTAEAQSWLNIVLVEGFISGIAGDDWEDEDPSAQKILSIISRAWSYQIQSKYPDAKFSIETINDPEYGDFGLRLLGSVT